MTLAEYSAVFPVASLTPPPYTVEDVLWTCDWGLPLAGDGRPVECAEDWPPRFVEPRSQPPVLDIVMARAQLGHDQAINHMTKSVLMAVFQDGGSIQS